MDRIPCFARSFRVFQPAGHGIPGRRIVNLTRIGERSRIRCDYGVSRVPWVPDVVLVPVRGRARPGVDPGSARLSLPSRRWPTGTGALWQRDGPDRRVAKLRR